MHHLETNIYIAWFWSVCLIKLRKNPPNSLPELANTGNIRYASLHKDQIIAAVRDILPTS